ncbi:hypothetical protein DKM44_02365 [Deinococcus irradiatisoli]|uniref:Uncharacterized protein n=2 Tax=Deinococcus irradiatisoli TaxID=2202254 RepID=A0A2Z3JFG2_9DEIO|nr:hypothetical protein DKM44_02365 [Deinococcus irradiatisoli]
MIAALRTLTGRPKVGGGTESGAMGNLIREEDGGYAGLRYILDDDGTDLVFDDIPNESRVNELTLDQLYYRPASYYGIKADRSPDQISQGLLEAADEAGALGGRGIVQLPPYVLDFDHDMIPGDYGGLELCGVRGHTVLRPALTSASPLLPGANLTLRDLILDGLGRVTTGVATQGALYLYDVIIRNILGTDTASAYGLWQQQGSTELIARGLLIEELDGYDDGITANNIGAPRGILLAGQYADLDLVTVKNVRGATDADAIQIQTTQSPDPEKIWTDSFARFGRVRVIDPGKRAFKAQGSNVTVEELIVSSTDETDANCLYAGAELFGSDIKIGRLVVNTPRALYGFSDQGKRNRVRDAVIYNGVVRELVGGVMTQVTRSYTTARGSSLRGYSDLGSDNSFEGVIYSSNWGAHYAGSSKRNTSRLKRVYGKNPILMDNGATGHDVYANLAEGKSDDLTWMDAAMRLATGTMSNTVFIKEARYGVNGTAVTGTADLNNLTIEKLTSITTALNTFGLTASNNNFGSATGVAAKASTLSQPAVSLPPLNGQFNPYLDRTFGDMLEYATSRLSTTVVSVVTGATPGVSTFTAASLVGQNSLQQPLVLADGLWSYPFRVEVDFGTGDLAQGLSKTYQPTSFVPAALFYAAPVGLTKFKVETYDGTTWTTFADLTGLTTSQFLKAPAGTMPLTIKKVAYTLDGAGASGSLSFRRVLLYGSGIDPTQFKHPGWPQFVKAHNADGTPAVLTFVTGTPSYKGKLAVVAGVGYMAVGTSSSADWKQITN